MTAATRISLIPTSSVPNLKVRLLPTDCRSSLSTTDATAKRSATAVRQIATEETRRSTRSCKGQRLVLRAAGRVAQGAPTYAASGRSRSTARPLSEAIASAEAEVVSCRPAIAVAIPNSTWYRRKGRVYVQTEQAVSTRGHRPFRTRFRYVRGGRSQAQHLERHERAHLGHRHLDANSSFERGLDRLCIVPVANYLLLSRIA